MQRDHSRNSSRDSKDSNEDKKKKEETMMKIIIKIQSCIRMFNARNKYIEMQEREEERRLENPSIMSDTINTEQFLTINNDQNTTNVQDKYMKSLTLHVIESETFSQQRQVMKDKFKGSKINSSNKDTINTQTTIQPYQSQMGDTIPMLEDEEMQIQETINFPNEVTLNIKEQTIDTILSVSDTSYAKKPYG